QELRMSPDSQSLTLMTPPTQIGAAQSSTQCTPRNSRADLGSRTCLGALLLAHYQTGHVEKPKSRPTPPRPTHTHQTQGTPFDLLFAPNSLPRLSEAMHTQNMPPEAKHSGRYRKLTHRPLL